MGPIPGVRSCNSVQEGCCLVPDGVFTACPQHFPHPLTYRPNVVIFCPGMFISTPSLILFLAGLKTCLNHEGSLITISYQRMLLEWGRGGGGEGGAGRRGHDLFLKVVFPCSIRLFCLCARLEVKVLRSSQRELLGNVFFYLQKFLVFIKPLYAILLSCLCQYIPTVLRDCYSFSFSLSLPLPPGFPILAPVYLFALLCSFLILTASHSIQLPK